MEFVCGPSWNKRIIEIEPKEKIALCMSGGIDSWVLYNLLGKFVDLNDIGIFNLRKDEFDVVHHVKKLTNRNDIIIVDDEDRSVNRFNFFIEKIKDKYDYEEIYIALNVIPHLAYFPEFSKNGVPNRPWKIDQQNIKAPFLHLYKYHIIDLAHRHFIDLRNTHSCIASPIANCGTCWQCMERSWAFDQLTLNDERYKNP
jgi:tRNA(Ile)-lysidine synthase TilS/MesJ